MGGPHKYSSPPVDCPYVEVVSSVTGETLFVPVQDDDTRAAIASQQSQEKPQCLLAKPMEQLMVEAAESRSMRVPDPAAELEMQMNCAPDKEAVVWSEKYRANHYIDLVSEGSVNRRVLSWVKQWDPAVFNTAPKAFPSLTNKWDKQEGKGLLEREDETRPEQTLLLLVG